MTKKITLNPNESAEEYAEVLRQMKNAPPSTTTISTKTKTKTDHQTLDIVKDSKITIDNVDGKWVVNVISKDEHIEAYHDDDKGGTIINWLKGGKA